MGRRELQARDDIARDRQMQLLRDSEQAARVGLRHVAAGRKSGEARLRGGGRWWRRKAAAFERGARLWAENACATCHVHGEKGAPPHKLADLSARYDLVSLDRFLQAPQPPMPLYPFSESQRRDLSTWLLTTYR